MHVKILINPIFHCKKVKINSLCVNKNIYIMYMKSTLLEKFIKILNDAIMQIFNEGNSAIMK